MSLVFYTNPMSRGRMVRWMLEEVGAPYETKIMGADLKAPDFLALNPMGKIPVLVHDGVVITETAAIITYLADAFPAAGLAPAAGSAARGAFYRWLFFAAGPLEAAMLDKALGVDIPPGRDRMAGYGTFGLTLDVLEQAVSHSPYLLGDHFSAADLYLGAQIGFGLMFKSIEPRPAFSAYLARISGRPAAVRAREIDDALIAAEKAK